MGGEQAERAKLGAIGALGGLSLWWAAETWQADLTRPVLGATTFAMVFFAALLFLAGSGRLARAVSGAVLVAVPVAALTLLASLRHAAPGDFVAAGYPLAAAFVMAALPIPFLIAGQRDDGDWRHYPTLFVTSWALVLKAMAALFFVGIVWMVLALCSELLELVGIDHLQRLMGSDWFGPVLSGTAFGLGLAVLGELADFVVPRLVLRLLRLFLPVALLVGIAFLAGLPFRGLSGLFGARSTAGVLMAIAFGAIALISIAAADEEAEAVRGRVMRGSARGLALLLPVMAGLAAWAIRLRVVDYGWTPERVVAAMGAVIVVAYAAAYAFAALRPGDWMARVRRGNVALALGLVVLAGLWLTPLLDAGAISVRSQTARFAEGLATAEELPVWEMQHDWGRTGPTALDALLALEGHDGAARLAELVAWARTAEHRWVDRPADIAWAEAQLAALRDRALLVPAGADLPDWFDAGALLRDGEDRMAACDVEPVPGRPGCAVVIADFVPASAQDEVLVLALRTENPDGTSRLALTLFEYRTESKERVIAHREEIRIGDAAALWTALEAGDFSLVPQRRMLLKAGDTVLEPGLRPFD